jgi:sulfate adenylyltransferase
MGNKLTAVPTTQPRNLERVVITGAHRENLDGLIPPHGGRLVNLLAGSERASELRDASRAWPSWDLTARQLCDLELLINGGFSPLTGFMTRADYESVCSRMRLTNGTLWPIPITLDVPHELAGNLGVGATLALRDPEGVLLAALHAEDVWQPDLMAEAETVYGTTDRRHPGIAYLLDRTNHWFVGGKLEGVQLPSHYDFRSLRLGPAELRHEFSRLGWQQVVAFHTRSLMHRAHLELTSRASKETGANLLLHPVVGITKPGEVEHYTRVRCYQALLPHYPPESTKVALLPLAMRMAGPKEAVWHALIRKNHGCTHFMIGPNHGEPGNNGRRFYDPHAAQDLLRKCQDELGMTMVPFEKMVYVEEIDRYLPENEVPEGLRPLRLSGKDLQKRLAEGTGIPQWFTYSEVARQLEASHPPRRFQGFSIFFTGLSGSGKSTTANILLVKLLELGTRPVTLLDGDHVRKHLSSELGFSRQHREINIRRIGFVAAEIAKNGGIAICAPIAPHDSVRKEVRAMVEAAGGFLLVYLATPLEVCEKRDRKGLYAKARAGLVKEFTGISDPYEPPRDADLVLDTTSITPEQAAQQILIRLVKEGYIDLKGD